jgi:hypothetical protein
MTVMLVWHLAYGGSHKMIADLTDPDDRANLIEMVDALKRSEHIAAQVYELRPMTAEALDAVLAEPL